MRMIVPGVPTTATALRRIPITADLRARILCSSSQFYSER